MRLIKVCLAGLSVLFVPTVLGPAPGGGAIIGSVTYAGTPAKAEPINMSKEPDCVKLHAKPLMTEKVVTGPGNTVQNVVVYISAGASDNSAVPTTRVNFDQQGCYHSTTHVLAFHVGQDVKISNSDPFSHNIHPMAKINREWNRIQPPGTPPFAYSYENEEFIPIKCNIHSWMQAYFVVFRTSYFCGNRGRRPIFAAGPSPRQIHCYSLARTLRHESQEITIGGSQTLTVNFVFQAKP